MLPDDTDAITAVLFAVVPGFIAAATWSRARTWKEPATDLRLVLQALTFSVLIQLVMAPLTLTWLYPYRHELADHPRRLIAWSVLAVVVVPILGGLLVGRAGDWLTNPDHTRRLARVAARLWPSVRPTPWDWLFLERPPDDNFVLIEFTDGTWVAGVFDHQALAMTSPETPGIFFSEEWVVEPNGDIIRPVPNSTGVLIPNLDNIKSIRLLTEGKPNENPDEQPPPT